MYKHNCLKTVLALSILSVSGLATTTVRAEETTPVPSVQNQEVTIPKFSAIVINFPSPVTVTSEQKQSLPTTAVLNQPLLDSNGNIVVPANSPVNVQLKPTNKGAEVKADSLVIGGRVIPIKASTTFIPGHSKDSNGGNYPSDFSNLCDHATPGLNTLLKPSIDITNSLNGGCKTLEDVTRMLFPNKSWVVEIPQGITYVLTLETPLTVPAIESHANPTQPTGKKRVTKS